MAKLQFATLSNLTEFLSLHNVQIDAKISEAVKSSIKTVSQSADGFTLYFYTKTAPVTIEDAVFTITLPKDSAKADKVTGAVNGHLAGLDADGNLVDSGKSAADFDEAGAATKAKSEVMTYVGTIPASATAKDVVAYISEVVTKNAYDDSTLRADVNKNTAAITKLNGEGEGSVKKAVADAVRITASGGFTGTFYGNLSGKASTAGTADVANSVAWSNVSGKPGTFTPSSHTHTNIVSRGLKNPCASGTTGNNASTEVNVTGLDFTMLLGLLMQMLLSKHKVVIIVQCSVQSQTG